MSLSPAPTPQAWCCPTWLVSSSPCTPSEPISPPRSRPWRAPALMCQVLTTRAQDQGSRPPPSWPRPWARPPGTGAHLASYAGLAPVTRRSGSSIRSEVHLPRRQQEAQARHIPVRLHLPALRPPGRTGPRHRGPAPLRAARRPHHRPAVWSESSFTYRRPGIHRAGHDHPEEKTRETAPSPPDDKTYNRTVDQIRYEIERVIANTQGPGGSCIPATEDHRKLSR